MAKTTQFALNQYGQLVYRKSGALAPDAYRIGGKNGNIVYGSDGRKVGQIGKGTKQQQQKIQRVATAGGRSQLQNRYSFDSIRRARERALRGGRNRLKMAPVTAEEAKKFGKGVKNMALLSIGENPKLYEKIKNMDDKKLLELYRENKLIFDVYYDYGGVITSDGKGVRGTSDTAKNAEALIEAYEQRYGSIGYQSVLV